jgi:hypothetical protein
LSTSWNMNKGVGYPGQICLGLEEDVYGIARATCCS